MQWQRCSGRRECRDIQRGKRKCHDTCNSDELVDLLSQLWGLVGLGVGMQWQRCSGRRGCRDIQRGKRKCHDTCNSDELVDLLSQLWGLVGLGVGMQWQRCSGRRGCRDIQRGKPKCHDTCYSDELVDLLNLISYGGVVQNVGFEWEQQYGSSSIGSSSLGNVVWFVFYIYLILIKDEIL